MSQPSSLSSECCFLFYVISLIPSFFSSLVSSLSYKPWFVHTGSAHHPKGEAYLFHSLSPFPSQPHSCSSSSPFLQASLLFPEPSTAFSFSSPCPTPFFHHWRSTTEKTEHEPGGGCYSQEWCAWEMPSIVSPALVQTAFIWLGELNPPAQALTVSDVLCHTICHCTWEIPAFCSAQVEGQKLCSGDKVECTHHFQLFPTMCCAFPAKHQHL